MDRNVVVRLAPIVSDPSVSEALAGYFQEYITMYQNQLTNETDIIRVRQLQGKIQELKRLLNIRDEMIAKAKEIYNGG